VAGGFSRKAELHGVRSLVNRLSYRRRISRSGYATFGIFLGGLDPGNKTRGMQESEKVCCLPRMICVCCSLRGQELPLIPLRERNELKCDYDNIIYATNIYVLVKQKPLLL
jgi:hypothetical protein